jgi:hypothetical protein
MKADRPLEASKILAEDHFVGGEMRRVIHIGKAAADELQQRAGSHFWDEDRMTVEVVETQDGELFPAGYVKKSKAKDP